MRAKTRMAIGAVIAVLFAYLLLAYFVIPEIWIFHDAERIDKVGDMVTTTAQGIPAIPSMSDLLVPRKKQSGRSRRQDGILPIKLPCALQSISD